MRLRVLAAALAASAAAIATSPTRARADGVYFTESFGPGTLRDQSGGHADLTTFRLRAGLGLRAGLWEVEPFLAAELTDLSNPDVSPSLAEYGLDVKRLIPVTPHISLYVRGSMSHVAFPGQQPCCVAYGTAALIPAGGDMYGFGGRGLGGGVGAQIAGKVRALGLLAWPLFFTDLGPKVNAGLFIEDSYDYYRFLPPAGSGRGSIDASISRLTVGFAVGSDF